MAFTHVMDDEMLHQHDYVDEARDCEADAAVARSNEYYFATHQHIYSETPDGYGCRICLYN